MNAIRIGNGFDIHRLVANRPLILGGVNVPFDRGLQGHSDGDALTHAVMNALLGAVALGDIGTHFPPSDPAYEGANSLALLAEVATKIKAAGYRVINVDCMIICEKPKLSSLYPAMRENLAGAIGINSNEVSVKASTAEQLGALGAGEGIAVYSVALLCKI